MESTHAVPDSKPILESLDTARTAVLEWQTKTESRLASADETIKGLQAALAAAQAEVHRCVAQRAPGPCSQQTHDMRLAGLVFLGGGQCCDARHGFWAQQICNMRLASHVNLCYPGLARGARR